MWRLKTWGSGLTGMDFCAGWERWDIGKSNFLEEPKRKLKTRHWSRGAAEVGKKPWSVDDALVRFSGTWMRVIFSRSVTVSSTLPAWWQIIDTNRSLKSNGFRPRLTGCATFSAEICWLLEGWSAWRSLPSHTTQWAGHRRLWKRSGDA